ncbi:MAG TPA: enolase C-terminal domain-like protein [Isosphaeraceae bacterium]|jgi:L-alanine-DL-glutamate epimerase-like enolase superfamily enzyme|nr:enolase C-terminal domain-like protein [Isosphaeraceae bacterium]
MPRPTDVRPIAATLYFLPIRTRVPLKFGPETLTEVTCARVRLAVADRSGRVAEGWGETPLSVQWVWPSTLPFEPRQEALKRLCVRLVDAWADFGESGHPIEVGHAFTEGVLPRLLDEVNAAPDALAEPMPWLAALVCSSAFDIALHDAFGDLHPRPIYEMYDRSFLGSDLARFLEPAEEAAVDFRGRFPADFLEFPRPDTLPAWHLVGGKDPVDESERTGDEPDDGYPVLLRDWVRRDGLKCLKVKLRGDDDARDMARLLKVGRIAIEEGVDWLSADFNCTVQDPEYVNDILDRTRRDHPRLHGMLLYVEQPFPYDLEHHRIDVRSVAARKPLFMDESAHDWRLIRLGRSLGWSGVALKTCKTQTGAILGLCWAKAHGMPLMVQDLSNPMLAQVPHVLLAAHAGTIMGVETNGMQFYPDASTPEAAVHPGLYRRRDGRVDLRTLDGPGFGYRLDRIARPLPEPVASAGDPA